MEIRPWKVLAYCHFCQTPGLVWRLGIGFVLPLSQEEEEQEQEEQEEPSPKFSQKGRH